MNQTKIESVIESTVNHASGFILAMCIWEFIVAPLIKSAVITIDDNLIITTIFFVFAFARSYSWRRFFNAGLHKAVRKMVIYFWNKNK